MIVIWKNEGSFSLLKENGTNLKEANMSLITILIVIVIDGKYSKNKKLLFYFTQINLFFEYFMRKS